MRASIRLKLLLCGLLEVGCQTAGIFTGTVQGPASQALPDLATVLEASGLQWHTHAIRRHQQ